MVFVLRTGGDTGHMGLIEKVQGSMLTTIEGNTNLNGSREGVGGFRIPDEPLPASIWGFWITPE
jgi:hypothetical protein